MKTVRVSFKYAKQFQKKRKKMIEKVSCGLKMPSKYSLNI